MSSASDSSSESSMVSDDDFEGIGEAFPYDGQFVSDLRHKFLENAVFLFVCDPGLDVNVVVFPIRGESVQNLLEVVRGNGEIRRVDASTRRLVR